MCRVLFLYTGTCFSKRKGTKIPLGPPSTFAHSIFMGKMRCTYLGLAQN